ncbi:hypothetical protein, partial [Acinetobacter nosocomialis]|uniref:hypothetical protein n=1 Tax=Acinetobacter nosocomialis TaxID=106654 RepID=UPI00148F61AC
RQLGSALGDARFQIALDFAQRGARAVLLFAPALTQTQSDEHGKDERHRKRGARPGYERSALLVARVDQHGDLPAEQA